MNSTINKSMLNSKEHTIILLINNPQKLQLPNKETKLNIFKENTMTATAETNPLFTRRNQLTLITPKSYYTTIKQNIQLT